MSSTSFLVKNQAPRQRRRALRQWPLALVTVAVIALGWWIPSLGLLVPAVMMTGMVGGFFRGRWVCGNVCPRGSFFDRILSPLAGRRRVPTFMRGMRFRWAIFAALITLMIVQLARGPLTLTHWGRVFWLMCTLTTGVGIVLSFFTNSRAWCIFCPVGTFARAVAPKPARYPAVGEDCRACGVCDKACPMGLPVSKMSRTGKGDADCIQCGLCAAVCPFAIIE
jgi:ferredoxin-type protein NapH